MENKLERHHVVIIGKVQGVSFRYNTQRKANELGITGWVKNKEDGTVEVLAEGTPEQMQRFKQFLRVGPPGAYVETVHVVSNALATGQYRGFNIRY